MSKKTVARSTTIDKHGDYVGLNQLQDYVDVVNGGLKIRYLANHRRDLPPVGYLDNAEIKQDGAIHHALVEPIIFTNRKVADWNTDLIIEDSGSSISFVSRNDIDYTKICISVDKNNFSSFNSFNRTGENLTAIFEGEVILDTSMRKSYLPDPQLVITLVGYYTLLKPLIKPLLSKIGEIIAEDIGQDAYELAKKGSKKLFTNIADTIRIARKNMIPKNKVLLTIFEIPGDPYIELQIKSDDPNRIIKAISDKNLLKIHSRVQDLQGKINIAEICFVYNSKNKWEFTYLISKIGEVVGTKSSYSKRDKLMNRINLIPTKSFSIGANGVKYEKQQLPKRPSKKNP